MRYTGINYVVEITNNTPNAVAIATMKTALKYLYLVILMNACHPGGSA